MSNSFIFASPDSRNPLTARKVHLRRLYDILQLSLQRGDFSRAKRAWSILARCKEIHWRTMWKTAMLLLDDPTHNLATNGQTLEFLRAMMLRHPDERQSILKELVLRLILMNRHREALDELDFYLPSFPYQDNPVLHAYAGLISLYLSQTPEGSDVAQDRDKSLLNPGLIRNSQVHLERSKALDPDSVVVSAFLEKLSALSRTFHDQDGQGAAHESDEDIMDVDGDAQRGKRLRV